MMLNYVLWLLTILFTQVTNVLLQLPTNHKLGERSLQTSKNVREHEDYLIPNISRILDNLLKNYDRNRRPGYGGSPTVVTTNVVVRSLGPISEMEMTYQMDCYFRQSWCDERLKFEGPVSTLHLNIKMLEGIWKPDTYFHNEYGSYIHTITIPNKLIRIHQDGNILYSMRLTIKAKCIMHLQRFPMDKQSCPLLFGSYAYTIDDVVYMWDSSDSITLSPGMALSQFDLVGSPHRNISVRFDRGDFSVLQVNFNLQRHTGYFIIQVYVPCVLIVILSWVSFWLNREATADRVGLGITTVLTLSTFGLDSRMDLPKVQYATALDWFVIICFGFVIASLLQFAGVHFYTKTGSGEPMIDDFEEWEEAGKEDPPSITGSINEEGNSIGRHRQRHAFTQTSHGQGRACCIQFVHCIMGNDSPRWRWKFKGFEDGKVNSVSKIDKVSRVVFPGTFAAINFCYWIFYTRNENTDLWA